VNPAARVGGQTHGKIPAEVKKPRAPEDLAISWPRRFHPHRLRGSAFCAYGGEKLAEEQVGTL